MSIYHMSIKVIGRSSGRSAIASAAYISGERLHSEETDKTFDYTRKSGVVYSEIVLCNNAPEEYRDRETLWNAVQAVEKSSDARLARTIECALPRELSREEQIEVAREFAKSLASQGMIIDWALHDKGDGNPHVHCMATTRPITKSGEWGSKQRKEYALDKDGNRIPVIDKATGLQKVEAKTGRKVWKRVTVDSTKWDDRSNVEVWRAKWAEICNKRLSKENQIDHRSYERQGIDKIPTIHEGYSAQKADAVMMRKEGRHGDIVQRNLDIAEANRQLAGIRLVLQMLQVAIAKIKKEIEKMTIKAKEFNNVTIGEILQRSRSLRDNAGASAKHNGQGTSSISELGTEIRDRRAEERKLGAARADREAAAERLRTERSKEDKRGGRKSILAELDKRKKAQPERSVIKGTGREGPGHGISC